MQMIKTRVYSGVFLIVAAIVPAAFANAQTPPSCEVLEQQQIERCYERQTIVEPACNVIGEVGGALVLEELIGNEFLENLALVIYGRYLGEGCESVGESDLQSCMALVENRVVAQDPSCATTEDPDPATDDSGGEGEDDGDSLGDVGNIEDLIEDLWDEDVDFTNGNDWWDEGEVNVWDLEDEDYLEEE